LNIATATIINPGYQGIVTLELANFGEIPIKLYPGLRIAQIAFYELRSENPEVDRSHLDQSQFKMSFEPQAGKISDGDDKFLRTHVP
jgi:dCTP deaminase